MKSILLIRFLKSFVLLLIISSVNAEEPRFYIPDAPAIGAVAYVVMDHNSGAILASNNEDEKRAPASLTKLMTSYVVFQRIKEEFITLEDDVKITSKKAWSPGRYIRSVKL